MAIWFQYEKRFAECLASNDFLSNYREGHWLEFDTAEYADPASEFERLLMLDWDEAIGINKQRS